MKCKKCSTPIIPGEKRCRFCGSTMIIEEENKKREPEIIDIIDDTILEKQPEDVLVVSKKELKKEPEIIDIIDEPKKDIDIIDEPKKDIDVTDELDKTTRLNKIDIEEFTGKISKEELNKIEEKKEKKEENKKEENKEIKKEENNENEEEKPFNEKMNSYVIFIVIFVLLVISLVFNLFLFLNRNVTKKVNDTSISDVKTLSFFNNYELSIPDNWYTKTELEKNLLVIFDSTNEWAASVQVLNNVDYKLANEKADEIQELYSKNRYVFTSNYNKKINETEYFLYKGKYENYSVYLILQKYDDKTVILTDLKFKGEIRKDVLDTILESLSNIKTNNLNKLYEDDFKFEPVGSIISDVAKKEEEMNKK